jgi:type IV secretion system protein VirB10
MRNWLRGRPPGDHDDASANAGTMVDPQTGEIVDTRSTVPGPHSTGRAAEPPAPHTVAGERTIPSVNRVRSVQSRVSNVLAVGTILLLGGGFLAWYYSTQLARSADADAAARKATESRLGGDSKLVPLGRVDPPKVDAAGAASTPVAFGGVLGPAPPAPPQSAPPELAAAPPAPPAKTPAQLALERKLGQPVLLRSRSATPPNVVPTGGVPPAIPQPPNLAAVLGMQDRQGTPDGTAQPSENGTLGRMLVPTATPAVAAQVLPTRRLLLPKGAFVDCTLETAIDSTFDGMVTCIGASDVYSADGRVVLLERGTKYVGEKRGEARQGQARVFVLWNEARTPTGVVVNLASPGTDQLGRAGLPGFVDTHFWDRFGAAILISVVDGALQALAASQRAGSDGTAVVLNPQGSRDVLTEVLKSTVAIPPTVVKNQGDRIQVLVARDVDFRSVYALRADSDGK